MIPDLLKGITPYVVDSLPTRERDVINALFWEQISLRELAERMGETHWSVLRTRDRAMRLIKERLEALDRSYRDEPE